MLKKLIYTLFMLASTQSYAICNVSVDEIAFGEIAYKSENEFMTSGNISITCGPQDIGNIMSLSFDKDYIALDKESTNVRILMLIQNELVIVDKPYSINITSTHINIPLQVTIERETLRKAKVGQYYNPINLRYTYDIKN